jgi:hypothetical protein
MKGPEFDAFGETPAIALLIAILRRPARWRRLNPGVSPGLWCCSQRPASKPAPAAEEVMKLSADQRDALEMLAGCPQGATEDVIVFVHRFDRDTIAGLVRIKLAACSGRPSRREVRRSRSAASGSRTPAGKRLKIELNARPGSLISRHRHRQSAAPAVVVGFASAN